MAALVCDGIADSESFVWNVDEPGHVVVPIFLIAGALGVVVSNDHLLITTLKTAVSRV